MFRKILAFIFRAADEDMNLPRKAEIHPKEKVVP
jgi:hypothetical protein